MEHVIRGRVVVNGRCSGLAIVCGEPLSFWGGYDPGTGTIIDQRLSIRGMVAAGRILAVPATRGSSTTTAILLESIRAGTAPRGIITIGVDSFLALADVISEQLYGKAIPITAVTDEEFSTLKTGDTICLEEGGTVIRTPQRAADVSGDT